MENNPSNHKILKTKYIPTSEFYSQVIDSIQDYSIFTLDNDLVINSWSSGSTNIFGYETEEILGESFDIIFTEEDLESGIPQREIEISLKEGRASDNRWHVAKDKSKFYAYGLVFPLIGIDGARLGFVKILRDLTERKKSEDAIKKNISDLQDLNTHKESVIAILSHDLRSPLAGIIGMTNYLKMNFQKVEPHLMMEMLDMLHKSATDELNMLDYLVDWARIKYAADVFTPTKIKFTEYVEKVFQTLKEGANLKTVKLLHEIDESITVFADGRMLVSIIQNLVSNAIMHTQDGGTITIYATNNGDKTTVEVKDTGKGMSKTSLQKLFKPQVKALTEARKENKGAGIGLLLVKGFLEKNDGEIWVESVEGEGTSFYFSLPKEISLPRDESSDEIMFDSGE